MRWKPGFAVTIAILAVVAAATPASGHGAGDVQVLFDFGGGRSLWFSVHADEGLSAWNATVAAAGALGLALKVSGSGTSVFVEDIGDSGAVYPDWWHLLVYDGGWRMADAGVAAIAVGPGDAIAWFLTRDDPSWDFVSPWPGPGPEATPGDEDPAAAFRYQASGWGLARSGGPTGLGVDWAFDTGAFEITGTPAISHGVVYLPTWTGFLALTTSGVLVWRNDGVAGASSPALYGPHVLVGGRDGRLHALWRSNGTEAWNLTLQPGPVYSGITSSPRVGLGKIFLGTYNETGGNGTFFAIDAFTRAVAWSRSVSSVHFSTPALANGMLIVGLMGRFDSASLTYEGPFGLLALDAESGAEVWFYETAGSVASSPAATRSSVYATTKAGELLAVDLDGTLNWSQSIAPTIASPAFDGHRILVGDGLLMSAGFLRAFSLEGEPQWTLPLSGPVSASPTIAGDVAYAATNEEQGRVIAVNVSTGALLGSIVLDPPEYILSSPVVYGGALYVASDNGRLYRLGDAAVGGPDPLGSMTVLLGAAIGLAGVVAAAAFLVLRRSRRGP